MQGHSELNELRKAYATLRVDPRASPRDVRRQFRRLVRQWHPDRFAQDPQGQAEAARQLQQINRAYDLIQAASVGPGASAAGSLPAGKAVEPSRSRGPLSRSAINGIVRSIGTQSPIESLLRFLGWSWPLFIAFAINLRHCERWTDVIKREQVGREAPSALWEALLIGLSVFLLWRSKRRRDVP